MEQSYKIQLFLDKREDFGIIQPNNSYGTKNFYDWHINIPFTKTNKVVEDYVHVYMDPFTTTLTRQLVNPYFMEFGFFETVKSYSGTTDNFIDINYLNIDLKSKLYNIQINK